MRAKIPITKRQLTKLYIQDKKSTIEIAEKLKCHRQTISNRLREFSIPLFSPSQVRTRYPKYDFSGDIRKKAYILGFRLGDLNVYQRSFSSEGIVVRCHTTQDVQVDLIKNLFAKYGHINVSKSSYGMHINCYVNHSFDFLLSKNRTIPKWVEINAQTVNAFIAGYTDAEGNFIINQSKARFKIDSYDKMILDWITKQLFHQGIHVKKRLISKQGENRSDGSKFNKDLWRININEAYSLLRFINLIRPFIKHKKRLHDILICEKNIKERIINGTLRSK